jgi:hypothetical protein
MDVAGRVIMTSNQKITKENYQIPINNLNILTRGIYLLEVIENRSGLRKVFKLEKNK